ncbi:histidine kinase dimerization/phosphoacceptor domain -containing protein [Puniceibacterium sediminis]|uniref:Two-component sensor histidine kinase, contains HisKA and HATPase domains n=1 Tax=Puniceibacterium sediminis TaxID=1608407 RepID=A0A238XK24_9RHOB|nr:histidine kinase dimerization/phosphoacceptor domain -containing protein [Puniceibacterium sediminis]SNR59060.1 Two-component sensor histidine kinase, contains HisKA and HATPase domains [Puniceibacterium sediminis]
MIAPPPRNQTERLEALESLQVLDSSPEKGFDEVVTLAARICDVPVALISLVDRDRQWFKARFGFEPDQTPLEHSICSHAILKQGMLEIRDTWEDPRTLDNPLCVTLQDPIRFYAGAPLVTQAGLKLGTLCVLDIKPRQLTDLQRETLEVLAGQVMRQLELRRALKTEAVLRDEIDHRVKNSLQTVTSLIRLYSSRSRHPETRDALGAIGRRVDAIVQLHSELYQTSEFDMIRLDRYLARVAKLLQGSATANVRIETKIAPVSTDSRKAATLAMIVSEFCANAIKHAFPNGRSGLIQIELTQQENGTLSLICRDDGVGTAVVPADQDDAIVSIGKRLMETAAEQIGGEMTLSEGPLGYTLSLEFNHRPETPQDAVRADAP